MNFDFSSSAGSKILSELSENLLSEKPEPFDSNKSLSEWCGLRLTGLELLREKKGKLAKLNEGWGGKNLELCDICIS